MTRKHFESLAAMLREQYVQVSILCTVPPKGGYKDIRPEIQEAKRVLKIMYAISGLLLEQNPRFDADKFYKACGLPQLVETICRAEDYMLAWCGVKPGVL